MLKLLSVGEATVQAHVGEATALALPKEALSNMEPVLLFGGLRTPGPPDRRFFRVVDDGADPSETRMPVRPCALMARLARSSAAALSAASEALHPRANDSVSSDTPVMAASAQPWDFWATFKPHSKAWGWSCCSRWQDCGVRSLGAPGVRKLLAVDSMLKLSSGMSSSSSEFASIRSFGAAAASPNFCMARAAMASGDKSGPMESPQARRLIESRRGCFDGELSYRESCRPVALGGERRAGLKVKLAAGEGSAVPSGHGGRKKPHGGGVEGIGGRPKPRAGAAPAARGAEGGRECRGRAAAGAAAAAGCGSAAGTSSRSSSPKAPVIAVSVSLRCRLEYCWTSGEWTGGKSLSMEPSKEDPQSDKLPLKFIGSIGAMGRSMFADQHRFPISPNARLLVARCLAGA